MFDMIPVESSNISAVGYDLDTSILRVAFKHGGLYEYDGVSPSTFASLRDAESVGKEFHKTIKLGGYNFKKVS